MSHLAEFPFLNAPCSLGGCVSAHVTSPWSEQTSLHLGAHLHSLMLCRAACSNSKPTSSAPSSRWTLVTPNLMGHAKEQQHFLRLHVLQRRMSTVFVYSYRFIFWYNFSEMGPYSTLNPWGTLLVCFCSDQAILCVCILQLFCVSFG